MPLSVLLLLLLPPITTTAPADLLLQHDAVHARLEQGEDQAGLALQLAQAVENLGGGRAGEAVEEGGELCF